jgi:hypothetical protein
LTASAKRQAFESEIKKRRGENNMKNQLTIWKIAIAMAALLTHQSTMAQQPASKSAVQVSSLLLLQETSTATTPGQWVNLLSTNLRTANQKDLLVYVSLECGLYGRTLGKSKAGTTIDTVLAQSGVKVRVLVDGVAVAEPGEVNLCRKAQTLSTQLAQTIDACTDVNLDGVVTIPTECTFTQQQFELILDGMQANAFNFALPNVSSGVHLIQLQARIDINLSATPITNVEARATVGKGSLIVEEVRLIKNADINL